MATVFLTFIAACGRPVTYVSTTSPVRALVREPGPMSAPKPTAMEARLKSAGLDLRKLPPLERLDRAAILPVMSTFSDSLGIPCTGCHAEDDAKADTFRKRVARRMWNEFVRVLAFDKSGEPVYCDSCHQGRMFSLDHRDKSKVSDFMQASFVDGLKRVDGREHDCGTCHGDPPEFQLIAEWKKTPAPDLVLAHELPPPAHGHSPATPIASGASSSATSPPVAVVPPKPTPPVVKPPAPSGECGDKNNPCPLQKWMRANMATAVAANDTAALARALDRTASFSPNPSWSWSQMSKVAAAAARAGDMAGARKSCTGCHNLYKEPWKQSFRKRAVN